MAKFGDILKNLRENKKLTQEELGRALDITRQGVSNYEKNRRTPDYEMLEKIADFFNVDMDYLYGKNDIKIIEQPDNLKKKGIKIPVLGRVAAGIPIEAIEDIIDYEEIDEEMAKSGDFFGLQIKGQSMEPRMVEGDVIIVRKQPDVENGDIAVVIINGYDATVKILNKRKDGIILTATNATVYEPTFYSNKDIEILPVTILGKVVELRAKF